MKTESILRFGRRGLLFVYLGLLTAASLLTACVDEVNLSDESALVELKASPLKGQGLQLEAQVSNPALKIEKSGFRVDNGFDRSEHFDRPWLEKWSRNLVELPGQPSFSTLLKPQEEWMTDFVGYAYVVVNGKEYRSNTISISLSPDDMELHIPKVASVSALRVHCNRGKVTGTFEVTGEGFYGYPSLTGHPSYVQFVMDGGDFGFDYGEWDMKLTPTRITLPFTAGAFGKFRLRAIQQGEREYPVELPIELVPVDHLVAPPYALRSGEFVSMHEHLRDDPGYNNQKVDSLEVDHGQSLSMTNLRDFSQGDLFAVITDRDEVNCKQYIDNTPLIEPLVLKMAYPWEETRQLGSVPALPNDRVSTADAVWYVNGYDLCRFDPKSGQETRYALPFHAAPGQKVVIGKDDKGGLLVCHNSNSKSSRDHIYAFDPASAQFESLGYVSPYSWFNSDSWELLFLGREGNQVYLVHRISSWLHCFTRFNAELHSVEKRYLDDSPNSFYEWHFVGLHQGRIFVTINIGILYYLDLQGTNQSVDFVRMSEMPISFDRGLFYHPEFMEQSGHYLYVGNAPVARYDLDQADFPIEYLGTPRGAFRDLEVFTLDGDDCTVLEKTTGKTWRFVEDRDVSIVAK